MIVTKQQWIESGYQLFAIQGAKAFTVEGLAKKIGVSKSSFYHHFAEQICFIEELMKLHLLRSNQIADKEKKAQTIQPELINILIEHKLDLLFNRQLRIHQDDKLLKKTLQDSNRIIGQEFILLWMRDTNLPLTFNQANGLLSLALENFYLKINEENLNQEWLGQYFKELKLVAQNFLS